MIPSDTLYMMINRDTKARKLGLSVAAPDPQSLDEMLHDQKPVKMPVLHHGEASLITIVMDYSKRDLVLVVTRETGRDTTTELYRGTSVYETLTAVFAYFHYTG